MPTSTKATFYLADSQRECLTDAGTLVWRPAQHELSEKLQSALVNAYHSVMKASILSLGMKVKSQEFLQAMLNGRCLEAEAEIKTQAQAMLKQQVSY